jgi:ribose/xylose/arabinose/galactoside ABC-type transport system permease subunit
MQVANFSIGVQNMIKGAIIIFVLVLSANRSESD